MEGQERSPVKSPRKRKRTSTVPTSPDERANQIQRFPSRGQNQVVQFSLARNIHTQKVLVVRQKKPTTLKEPKDQYKRTGEYEPVAGDMEGNPFLDSKEDVCGENGEDEEKGIFGSSSTARKVSTCLMPFSQQP